MANDIFLSYSRRDLDSMLRVKSILEDAGLSVWTDAGLEPGTKRWQTAIEDAIYAARCMVVLLSPDAKKSDWVAIEVNAARMREHRVFPVLLSGNKADSVPIELINTQWVDARHDVTATVAGDLVPALQRYLAMASVPTTGKAAGARRAADGGSLIQPRVTVKQADSGRMRWIIAIALLMLIVVVVAVWQYWPDGVETATAVSQGSTPVLTSIPSPITTSPKPLESPTTAVPSPTTATQTTEPIATTAPTPTPTTETSLPAPTGLVAAATSLAPTLQPLPPITPTATPTSPPTPAATPAATSTTPPASPMAAQASLHTSPDVAMTATAEPATGTLIVHVLTKSGYMPEGGVETSLRDADGTTRQVSDQLRPGTYEFVVQYMVEPDPTKRYLQGPPWRMAPMYSTVHHTVESIEIVENELTVKTIYLPFDEGSLHLMVRTAAGEIPAKPSRIEISAPDWQTSLIRRPRTDNDFAPVRLLTDQIYRVEAIYGTGIESIVAAMDGITVTQGETSDVTILLPPYDEAPLTVQTRTESGRVLAGDATVTITGYNETTSAETTVASGKTVDEFTALLLAGTYNVAVTYQNRTIRRTDVRVGSSPVHETVVFSDTATLTVALRGESGMILDKMAAVTIRAGSSDGPEIYSTESVEGFTVELLPDDYYIATEYKITATDTEKSETHVQLSGDREVLITMPDLGTLTVLPRTQSGRVVNGTGSVIIRDGIGRRVLDGPLAPQMSFSALLRVGTYEIAYTYDTPSPMRSLTLPGNVTANSTQEVTVTLPFDEGQLVVSVGSGDEGEPSRPVIISVFDAIGRSIMSVAQNGISSWLPTGEYRILVEYGGQKVFDERRNVEVDQLAEVRVSVD